MVRCPMWPDEAPPGTYEGHQIHNHPRRASASRASRLNGEITARLPAIARNNLQKSLIEPSKSGCQRLPKNDLFATIRSHFHALNCEPSKALIPFVYRHFIGVSSGSGGINRTSTQRLGKPTAGRAAPAPPAQKRAERVW